MTLVKSTKTPKTVPEKKHAKENGSQARGLQYVFINILITSHKLTYLNYLLICDYKQCSKPCGSGEKSRKVFCMIGNATVDAGQCKPETLLYSSDECNKQPCGEGKKNHFHATICNTLIIIIIIIDIITEIELLI